MRRAAAIIAALVASALAAAPARAAPPKGKSEGKAAPTGSQGTVEFGLKGLHDLNRDEATAVYLDLTLGYFIDRGLEVGLTALQGTTPEGHRDTYGLFVEYDYITGIALVPFAGGALKHAAPPRGADTRDGKIAALYGGVNLMLSPASALSVRLDSMFADHAVLGPEGDRKRRDDVMTLGVRLFF